MKKIMIVAVAMLMAFTAKAQIYVGGNVGLDASSGYFGLNVLPEVGYNINDKMSVGAVLGVDMANWKEDTQRTDIFIIPYFRYTFLDLGPVKLFADARLDLNFSSSKNYDILADKWDDPTTGTFWGIGIAPGIAIPLTDKLSVVGHLGYLGYRYETFTLSADATDLTVGVYYCF